MATERLPRAKYLRQLAQMQRELLDWKLSYLRATAEHQDDWIGSRFALRAQELDGVIDQIVDLRDKLYQLPRLS